MRNQNPNCEVIRPTISSLQPAVKEVAAVFRRYRLTYDQSAYVVKRARYLSKVEQVRKVIALPKTLSDDELKRFSSQYNEAAMQNMSCCFD